MSCKSSILLVLIASVTPVARAVVETLDATITAEVEQTLPAGDVNTDLAFESLAESTSNLPLLAEARLFEDGYPNSAAGATARLADPRLAQTSDPAEIGIAVVSNSQGGPSSWNAFGSATETRSITFTASEIGAETGTALNARSFFFVDAILVLWRQAGSVDLTGTGAEISLRVEQTRAGAAAGTTVLTANLSYLGQADGTGTLVAGGSLVPENAAEVDLTDMVGSLGSVQVVLLPRLAIPYDYVAAVDENFTLRAFIDAHIESTTDTGAAVVLGPSVEGVTGLISDVAGEDVGEAIGQVLGTVFAQNPAPARPLTADDLSTKVTVDPRARGVAWWPGGLCGLLGVESLAGMALLAGFVSFGAVRRSRG